MMYPLVRELAAAGALRRVPVAVTCRVLKIARQPYYRWLADPVTDAEWIEAHRANALFDAHREDLEFGYRLLVDEARESGGQSMADRTAWRICSANGWWSVFGKPKAYAKARKAGAPAHSDLVARDFTADEPNRLWLTDITEHWTGEGKLVPLRDQGCVVEPDRRLLDRLADEVPPRGRRAGQRRRPSRHRWAVRGRMRGSQR
jgi:putative transposase